MSSACGSDRYPDLLLAEDPSDYPSCGEDLPFMPINKQVPGSVVVPNIVERCISQRCVEAQLYAESARDCQIAVCIAVIDASDSRAMINCMIFIIAVWKDGTGAVRIVANDIYLSM